MEDEAQEEVVFTEDGLVRVKNGKIVSEDDDGNNNDAESSSDKDES